ncbi:MAG TPA: sulfotransferase [Micromonosporaceae bacterium]|nr:sulfotransferase [Micromonosporaceae bacterium]
MTTAREDVRFDVPSLVADAAAAAGVAPTEFAFLDALEVLASSMDRQAQLTVPGRAAVRGALVAALCAQARLRRAVALHPEIATTEVTRPVFITGLLRSGTTLVHNLLAQHPGVRAPALWELMNPVGERGDAASYAALADAAQAYVEEYYQVAPDLPKIHFLDARRPDECHRLTANTFTTMVYEARYRVPDYAEWLRSVDHTPAYRFHRAQLQAILWRLPGGPVVLKDPFHLWYLPALAAAYPQARIVQLHRDPAVTVPSTCSLCVTIRGARSDTTDRAEIGQHWLAQVERALAALPQVRSTALATTPVLDVRYADLMADPIGTLGGVCEFIEAPLTTEAERAMREYLADNGATKHGRHRYSAAEFGLDESDLRRRFMSYRHEYGV